MILTTGLLLSYFSSALGGACDNDCSGHGICQQNGVCKCFDNWGVGLSHDSGDCSDRICPFEVAWIDTPDRTGQRHKYAECAGKGLCDRETGLCECFAGFEGHACQRSVCPNSCSGHGQCIFIDDFQYQTTPWDYYNNVIGDNKYPANVDADWAALNAVGDFLPQAPKTFSGSYFGWDSNRVRGCYCDPEWTGHDCSMRMCNYANDVMDHRPDTTDTQVYHTQRIQFRLNSGNSDQNGNTFALSFKSKLNETYTTIPIVWNYHSGTTGMTDDFTELNRDIQTALQSLPGQVIDSVNVNTESRVYVDDNTMPVACSGTSCVAGSVITIDVEFVGELVQGVQNLLTVRNYECLDGCTPKLTGLELIPGSMHVSTVVGYTTAYTESGTVTSVDKADFNSYECGRRGKCDYETGICHCFPGYTGLACSTITALV